MIFRAKVLGLPVKNKIAEIKQEAPFLRYSTSKNVVTLKDSIALCMPTIVCKKGVYAEQLDERFAHDPKRRIHIPTSSATKNIQLFICGEDQMSSLVNLHVHPAEVCRQFVLHQPGP